MKGLIRRAEVVGKITSADMQMAYRQMTGTEVYQEILGILNEAQDVDAEPVTYGEWDAMMSVLNVIGSYDRLRELAEADKAGRVFITGTSPTDEQAKINWFELFLNRMRDYSDGDVWGNGDELMCKTEAIADAMCDLLFQLYAAQDEEVEFHTGYYDPAEDARSGEEDRCTGWWYVDCD